MSSKPFSLSFARCLLRLQHGEYLHASEMASKSLLKQFCDDGVIRKHPSGNRRVSYFCPEPSGLKNYLQSQMGILSLENYIRESESGLSDGENSLSATKSTKTLRKKSLQGFFIKVFHSNIIIEGETVAQTPNGIELFVHRPEALQISTTALVVGIENPECFLKFDQLAHLFPQKEMVIMMRYMSLSPNRWLQTLPNDYLHFGDFDPAGLSIYIQEYRKHLSAQRCRYFIPPNIEQLISQYGITQLYDQQIHLLKNINFHEYPEIENLFSLLHKYRKGVEQERLLIDNK